MQHIKDEGAEIRRQLELQELSRGEAVRSAYKTATSRRRLDKQELVEKSAIRIKPLQRVIPSKHTKMDHSPSPIVGSPLGPPPVLDRWWTKAPTLAGESSNKYQLELADPRKFTGKIKKLVDPNSPPPVAGDYIDNPKRAMKLLNARTYKELNISGRSADFCTEVNWRLSLRPDS